MMRPISAIIVCTLLCATQIHGKSIIHNVSRTDFDDTVQVFVYFDSLPRFEQRVTNKRLDITFAETGHNGITPTLSSDETIVKSQLADTGNDTILSLFFRYQPQKVSITEETANVLIVNISPGNEFTRVYRRFAENLKTTFVTEDKQSYTPNPLRQSRYRDNWAAFFSPSYSAIPFKPPLSVYIPPYPWVGLLGVRSKRPDIMSRPAVVREPSEWLAMLTDTQDALKCASEDPEKRALLLFHADILFRLGNINAAAHQLHQLSVASPEGRAGFVSRYLSCLLAARNGKYHLAQAGLRRLAEPVDAAHPLKPYLDLALLEIDLALGKPVSFSLNDVTVSRDGPYQHHAVLRSADALNQAGQSGPALQRYEEAGINVSLPGLPFSLHGYCSALLQQRSYQASSTCFQNLATILVDDDQRGAALYNSAVASAAVPTFNDVEEMLGRVITAYPRSEAAARAQMLLADRCVSRDTQCMGKAFNEYDRLAAGVRYREISSEALFKKALILHLQGNNRECVHELMALKRTFQSSEIRHHTNALLTQLVPAVIRTMLISGNEIQAITLARQNRQLFNKRWIDLSLLNEFIPVLERYGLYREAVTLQLFLMEQDVDSDRQKSYFTLTRLASLQGNQNLVENFSSQYLHTYPNGRYHNEILYFRIREVYQTGHVQDAETLLPTPLPEQVDFKLLAAAVYYQLDAFEKSAALLETMHKGTLPETHLFILAESLYNLGRIEEAETCFLLIDDVSELRSEVLLRLAAIERTRLSSSTDTYRLRTLAASAESGVWQRFASHELRFSRLMNMH